MKNDLISRADALALIEYMGPAFHAPTIREALARIKGLPAADAEQVVCWTPVENGLPDKQGWYLVTNKFGGVSEEWFGDMGEFEAASPGSYLSKDYAIAWAYMPCGYREVQHEQGSRPG